jgi:hypothetical protein
MDTTVGLPWTVPPLNQWSIVGMNHYHVNGDRCLFVAMVKDGLCIKEEGPDSALLWLRLAQQAFDHSSRQS